MAGHVYQWDALRYDYIVHEQYGDKCWTISGWVVYRLDEGGAGMCWDPLWVSGDDGVNRHVFGIHAVPETNACISYKRIPSRLRVTARWT